MSDTYQTIHEKVAEQTAQDQATKRESIFPGGLRDLKEASAKASAAAQATENAMLALTAEWSQLLGIYESLNAQLTYRRQQASTLDPDSAVDLAVFGQPPYAAVQIAQRFTLRAAIRDARDYFQKSWEPNQLRLLEEAGAKLLAFARKHDVPRDVIPEALRNK